MYFLGKYFTFYICCYFRQPTLLKDGLTLPAPDILMRQLIDIANSENPPCSNCDKRDRANMFYCNTCGKNTSQYILFSCLLQICL